MTKNNQMKGIFRDRLEQFGPALGVLFFALAVASCQLKQKEVFNIDDQLDYCVEQAERTLELTPKDGESIPRNIPPNSTKWRFVAYQDWTSGFWPGVLWYVYEHTQEPAWKAHAERFTEYLRPLSVSPANDHDLGFQVHNSFGHGYRLTGNVDYKKVVLMTSDTLETLYNPNVGTILSWPRPVPNMEWPQHNTIMDNMINLEMLFWAAKNGDNKGLYDLAVNHADKTMANHFRDDYTSYHVVVYDTLTGQKIKGVTHQGYSDESMWARGQAWAIYGYTMVYRETGNEKYLDFAQKVTNVYLDRLPKDMIPYWDFNAPNIPDEPRDASAAAVVASALIELAGHSKDPELSRRYITSAQAMLEELSTEKYQSRERNSAFLLHSTGHKPNRSEIDYSIIYADYYYIEALLRLKAFYNNEEAVASVLALN